MENPNCKTCARKKHCFVKEFKVLYCEDYRPEGSVPMIKDSGTRREFETGAVRDIQEGKGRCDLMPLDVIYRVYSSSYGNDSLVAVNFESLYKFTEGGDVAHLIDVIKYNSCYGYLPTTFLEVSKHFEEGAKKIW